MKRKTSELGYPRRVGLGSILLQPCSSSFAVRTQTVQRSIASMWSLAPKDRSSEWTIWTHPLMYCLSSCGTVWRSVQPLLFVHFWFYKLYKFHCFVCGVKYLGNVLITKCQWDISLPAPKLTSTQFCCCRCCCWHFQNHVLHCKARLACMRQWHRGIKEFLRGACFGLLYNNAVCSPKQPKGNNWFPKF